MIGVAVFALHDPQISDGGWRAQAFLQQRQISLVTVVPEEQKPPSPSRMREVMMSNNILRLSGEWGGMVVSGIGAGLSGI